MLAVQVTMAEHDAELVMKIPPTDGAPHGPDRLVAWTWTDGRRTMSPSEHETSADLIREAENRYNLDELESGDVVAQVSMSDDGTAEDVEWSDP